MPVARATLYRARDKSRAPEQPVTADPAQRRRSHRALTLEEQGRILTTVRSDRFADCAPAPIVATLLDEGVYLGSVSTIYRLLHSHDEVRERRNQLKHPKYRKPELIAGGPNQVWSWDITKLRGPGKWSYFYLYVILDIFSRKAVAWTVADCESAELAKQLILNACLEEGIQPGQLTIHADRGSAMTCKQVAHLMSDLGVTKTHSRPHVSDDNPFSESQFKTLKYRPDFPGRFGCIEDARQFCRRFFAWYNTEHRHSGIAMLTPDQMHSGHADRVIAARQRVLSAAYAAHPERFVRKEPKPQAPPTAAWINPPEATRNDSQGAETLQ